LVAKWRRSGATAQHPAYPRPDLLGDAHDVLVARRRDRDESLTSAMADHVGAVEDQRVKVGIEIQRVTGG
jgi:hypothetical protein